MSNTENRLPRVALGRSGRTVPKADVAAAEAYGRSEEAKVAKWLAFEREYWESLEEEAA